MAWLHHHQAVLVVLFLGLCWVDGQNNYQNPNQNQNNYQNPNQNQQYGNNNQGGDGCCEEYCYSTDEEPYLYFSTKTAYDSLNRRSNSQDVVPECTPVQFWGIIRHGTSLPTAENIDRLRSLTKLHEEILKNYGTRRSYPDKGRLCREDYDLFVRWRWNDTVTPERGSTLTSQGMEDMKLLARRYKFKYPQVFQPQYDDRAYYFQYETIEKTQETYHAYIEGLFGGDTSNVHANTQNNQRLSTNEGSCRNTIGGQDQFVDFRREYEKFTSNPDYVKMAHDVFTRLGFRYNLNASIIKDMYDMCRYEKAWNVQQKSPWCIAFNEDQLKLLEYAEDLKYYYSSGYGNRMAEKIGCSPVKDMYEKFEKTVNGDTSGNKVTVFFTKAPTLISVLTAMGVQKDYSTLSADNYYQQSRRNWKTSTLSPFAGNLAAILYQCRGNEKYKVMFFLNEIPVELPECSVGLCNWSAIEQKYQGLVKNCNTNDPCGENSASTYNLNYITYTLLVTVLLYFRV